jgi:hypothetical protein
MGQMRPILILTPGCAGSSKIADVLWRRHGVCFFHGENRVLRSGKPAHENREMKVASRELIAGRIGVKRWKNHLKTIHRRCSRVGVKNLDIALVTQSQLGAINPLLVIETTREWESLLDSWGRFNKKWSREEAVLHCRKRLDAIERLDWPAWASIEMGSRQWSDEQLENFSDGWMRMIE